MWLRSKVGISLPSSLPSKSVSGDLLESKSQFLSWSERGEDSVLLISPACFFPHPNRGRGRTCPGWPEHHRAHSHYADPETELQMGCTPLPTSFPVPRIRSHVPSLTGNSNREGWKSKCHLPILWKRVRGFSLIHTSNLSGPWMSEIICLKHRTGPATLLLSSLSG